MSTVHSEDELPMVTNMSTDKAFLDVPHDDFMKRLLLLYSSPRVTVRIGGHEYELPKTILCGQSPYFQATFEGGFKEGEDQSTDLTEDDGIVSPRSFELLVQWLILGRVHFGELEPEEAITATIEFVRIADMCKVTGMESLMAERIKDIILATRPSETVFGTPPEPNTHCLTSQHIESAALLPKGHAVRSILGSAAVKGYLRNEKHKFWREAHENVDFAVDLLREVRSTLNSLEIRKGRASVMDPMSRQRFYLEAGSSYQGFV